MFAAREDSGNGRAAVIAGVGGWVPSGTVTNHDLAARLDTSDEWIRSRTGIGARHVVEPGRATCAMAVEAGGLALKSAGFPTVDAVIVATSTPDRVLPATAPEVASRLGLGRIAAYDLAAVCTGFLYGLANAAGLIATRAADSVLVIGSDTFSTIVDPMDRGTAPIFGDGAGAVLVRAGDPDEPGAVGPVCLGSGGEWSELITIPAGGSRQRSEGTSPAAEDYFIQMQGRKVYRHATDRMVESSLTALERAGWQVGDVDRFAAHQANARIGVAVAERLGIPVERALSNIEQVGNTSGASLPLLLADSAAAGRLRPGEKVLLAAFGAGLTWGAATAVWPDVTALSVHDYRA
ncbi:beta-ketoacyl-ACP synthase III [Streptomyces sp. H27-D2]|uniref:beta-ketoacyl-ACP synthase III n=1 Tax=Streptomyces sp. H27-D2 TaxID=3046304 RepID=UPI002DBB22F6|nr:beta-ketoacyl-ACP synthase III [Streptomyces sp. H27-D2]MEC4019138.1 beta-ketoacyl-ACP synthase III [Streptomyces sp. H27-D2]